MTYSCLSGIAVLGVSTHSGEFSQQNDVFDSRRVF
jgi:hypothetical protein